MIEIITGCNFLNYNNITTLNLSNNSIYLIYDHAFDGLTSLTKLHLSHKLHLI